MAVFIFYFSTVLVISITSSSSLLSRMDAATPPPSIVTTTPRDNSVEIATPKYSAMSLPPINPNTTATALSRYFSSDAALDKIMYRLRSPIIANIFDEKTTRGFSVTPNMAGMLSTANTTSLISTAIMHNNIGVAVLTPSIWVKNRSPSNLSVDLKRLFANLTIALSLRSSSSSSSPEITLIALYIRTAENTRSTSRISWRATAPNPIIVARITMEPIIPQSKIRFWYSNGTLKYSNKSRKTRRLSTDNDCSRRYPA
mmetsp:Transcript_19895/g.43224  ORF Transcript_19895/g.43224 Transcript_19895/m.43224 type:complete len:257 (+) Transcript_19895:31-801(+)